MIGLWDDFAMNFRGTQRRTLERISLFLTVLLHYVCSAITPFGAHNTPLFNITLRPKYATSRRLR
jgi:hypothetical protein